MNRQERIDLPVAKPTIREVVREEITRLPIPAGCARSAAPG